jgi:hypothetical protein
MKFNFNFSFKMTRDILRGSPRLVLAAGVSARF